MKSYVQESRRGWEPRAQASLEVNKQGKEEIKTFNELWADSRWEAEAPARKDLYEPRKETIIQTRSGRQVRMHQADDMLFYK